MVNRTQNIAVLIPDGEIHVLLYVVNCLSLKKDIKIYVMSTKKSSHMKYSRFIEKYIYYPETNHDEWLKHINDEVERHDIDLVLPVYEMGIKIIVENIHKIKYPHRICNLPNIQSLNTAGNKGLLYLHLKEHEIPCPKSLIVKPNNFPEIEGFNFPMIIKPVEGGGGGIGIEIVKKEEDILNYYKTNKFNCNTIVEEFIEGYTLCCNVL